MLLIIDAHNTLTPIHQVLHKVTHTWPRRTQHIHCTYMHRTTRTEMEKCLHAAMIALHTVLQWEWLPQPSSDTICTTHGPPALKYTRIYPGQSERPPHSDSHRSAACSGRRSGWYREGQSAVDTFSLTSLSRGVSAMCRCALLPFCASAATRPLARGLRLPRPQ